MYKSILAIILAGGFIFYPSKLGSDSLAYESVNNETVIAVPVVVAEIDQKIELQLPFKVASNWVSDNSNLPGMVWQVGDKDTKFAIQDGKFIDSDPTDTWFVYGWFGPIKATQEAYNIKYPEWGNRHNGIDFAGKIGLEVVSASDGKVVFSGNKYGKTVIIESGSYKITYGHLQDILVKMGDIVQVGDLVGHLGATGTVNPHLHFEIDQVINGQRTAINPVPLINTDWNKAITPDTKANQFLNYKLPLEQANFEW
jgi:murein DD-endopeptidase MepM/ murein hydrolase activator NlpD